MTHPRRRRKTKRKSRKSQLVTMPSPSASPPHSTPPRTPPPTPPKNSFALAIGPPKRSFWAPFSHASTELNLLARPDFHVVCHALYQTFNLGALFPDQNPPPVTLPRLRPRVSGQPAVAVPSPPPPEDSPWAAFTSPKRVAPSANAPRGPLLQVFSAKVPMTPVRARRDSPYVSTRDRSVLIHPLAYAHDPGKGPQILCRAVINPSYTPDVTDGRVAPTLTYVGFEYSDQTCLTYIPIRDTRLVYRVSRRKERWFGEEVQMIMRRSVYERIKEMSVRAFLEKNPGTKVDCGNVEFQGVNVMLFVMVKANRTVRIELENRTVYRPLLETLNECKHDVCGEGLMHVRFSRTPGKGAVSLRFILFGIQATRTEANKMLRIFQIAENDKKG